MRYVTLFFLLIALTAFGCQQNRSAVIPPPGSPLGGGDPYYNRPLGTPGNAAPTIPPGSAPVSLAPTSLQNLPPPPTTTSATGGVLVPRLPRDTYDVATRVAADGQPIRVIDSPASYNGTLAGVPRGMPLNDGTAARSWQTNLPLPATVANNPFGQLRGTGETRLGSSQGFSGQDGQWRSRSSYEGTERR